MTQEQMQALAAQLAKLSPEQKAQLAQQSGLVQQTKITVKVTEKGGISVYGLGRFPVTLYPGQWRRLFAEAKQAIEAGYAKADPLAAVTKATKAASDGKPGVTHPGF